MASFTIDSEKNETVSNLSSLFDFLIDFKNFESILPQDRVDGFQFTHEQCSFNIKGITQMTIKIMEKKPHEYILFTSDGLGKFNFKLKVFLIGESAQPGLCRVELAGDLNPIILSFANQPLMQLVNTMSSRLSKLELN